MSAYTDSDEKIEVELEVNVTSSLAHILDQKPGLFAESTESLIKAAILNTKRQRTENLENHILDKFSKISPTAIRRCASVLKTQTNQRVPKAGIKLRIKNSMVKLSTANVNSRKRVVCGQKDVRILSGDGEDNDSDPENVKREMFLYEDTENEFSSKTYSLSDRSITSEIISKPSCLKNIIGDADDKITGRIYRNDDPPKLVTFIDDQKEQKLGPFARKAMSTNRYEQWMEDMRRMDERINDPNQVILSNPTSRTKLMRPAINKYPIPQKLKSIKNKSLIETIENNRILENEPHSKRIPENIQKAPPENITKEELMRKCYKILQAKNSTPSSTDCTSNDNKISAQFVYEIINFFGKDKQAGSSDAPPATLNPVQEQVVCPSTVESKHFQVKHKHTEGYSKKMTKTAKNPPKLSSESGQSRELRAYNFLKCLTPNVNESEPCYCNNCMATSILSESEKRPYIERPHRHLGNDLVSQNTRRETNIQEILPKSSSLNKTKFMTNKPEKTKPCSKVKCEKQSTSKSSPKEIKKNKHIPSMQTIYSSKDEKPVSKLPETNESEAEVPEKKNFLKSVLSKLKLLENKVRLLEKDSPNDQSEMKSKNTDMKIKSDLPNNPQISKQCVNIANNEPDPQPGTSTATDTATSCKKMKTDRRNFDKSIQVDLSITELDGSSNKSLVSRNLSAESKLIQIHYTDTSDSKRSRDKSSSSHTTRSLKNDNASNLSDKIDGKHKALSRTSNSFMVLVDTKPSDFNVKKKIQQIIEYKLLKIKKDLIELRYLNQVVLNDSEYFTQKDLFPSYRNPLERITEAVNSVKSKTITPAVKENPDSSVYNDITRADDSAKNLYSVTAIIHEKATSSSHLQREDDSSQKDNTSHHIKFKTSNHHIQDTASNNTRMKQSLQVIDEPSETSTKTSSKPAVKVNEESLANRCIKKFKSSIPRLKSLPQRFQCKNTGPSTKIGKLVPAPSVKVNKRVDMKFNSPFPDIAERTAMKNQINNRQMTYVYQVYNTTSKKTEHNKPCNEERTRCESSKENKPSTNSLTKCTASTDSPRTKNQNLSQNQFGAPHLVTIVPDKIETNSVQSENEKKIENGSSGDTNESTNLKNRVSSVIDDIDSLLSETIEDVKKNNGSESSQHTFRIKSDISFTYKDNVINEVVVNKSIVMQTRSNIMENIKQNCNNLLHKMSTEATSQDTSTDASTESNVCDVKKKAVYNNDEKPIIVQHLLKTPPESTRCTTSGSTDSKQIDSTHNDFLCCCPVLFKKKGDKKTDKQSEKQVTVPKTDNDKDSSGVTLTDNSIDQCFALWEDIYNNVTTKKKQDGPSTLHLNKKLLKYRFHDNSGLHEINITLDDLKRILRARAAVVNDTNDTDDESSTDY